MPTLQVNDESSEDDGSVVLEGGRHMFCHDIGYSVTCTLGGF